MSSPVKYLEWDSRFFNFPVYKITVTNGLDFEKTLSQTEDSQVLYYVFSDSIITNDNILSKYNGKLVDEKVILNKTGLQFKDTFKNPIEEYREHTPNDDLYQLAKISGEYSRYKTDDRLPSYTFDRMYNLWIENSCKNDDCIIYICRQDQRIVGFITLEIGSNSGTIGLIAVHDSMHGKGIGYELMRKAENHLVGLGIDTILVATQRSNENALNFYRRLEYGVKTVSNIYHFLINTDNIENSL
ncbi:GNAT family N-acetyltransferase [Gelidibacter salicanalis]|uniref:GNAT family N-acetyltransferase n=1 Tax=Gelidibacter salicanalis TaxID=291193 RepID=A0A5C7API1_9FLAO|nr:GNAT family N-acetyltransferase [Gelidibacter salicanalis]TXE08455.1 GNAT family N-acetyltransferase [Gelidibacter salicanalis]